MVDENVEKNILALHKEQKWKDIVTLNYISNGRQECRLFWVLPTINDLRWMYEIIKQRDMTGIVSVGCGCGLFEWLFQKYSGLDVIGIELDQSWWNSKYSPPLFLENILFVPEEKSRSLRFSDKYALLFCYFNNDTAFCNYIENYEGNLVFVIGPKEGQDRCTDPLPFDSKFEKYGWKLIDKKLLDRSMDYIVAYSKGE